MRNVPTERMDLFRAKRWNLHLHVGAGPSTPRFSHSSCSIFTTSSQPPNLLISPYPHQTRYPMGAHRLGTLQTTI